MTSIMELAAKSMSGDVSFVDGSTTDMQTGKRHIRKQMCSDLNSVLSTKKKKKRVEVTA